MEKENQSTTLNQSINQCIEWWDFHTKTNRDICAFDYVLQSKLTSETGSFCVTS